jgi:4-alpha-glucanotransferase
VTDRRQELARLRLLARLHGIQTSFVDLSRRTVRAPPASLLAALQAIGAPVSGMGDTTDAIRSRIQDLWRRPLEPVMVAWKGRPTAIRLRLPLWVMDARRRWSLVLEDGEELDVTDAFQRGDRGVVRSEQVGGSTYVEIEFGLALEVPAGYHRLHLDYGGSTSDSLLLSAPVRVRDVDPGRSWGVFLPLYAVRTQRNWGVGDLTDLGDLAEWTAGLGGGVVATLPILSAFLSEPFDPSPYSPASKLFWNELYLDVPGIPEMRRSPEARASLRSPRMRRDLAALQTAPWVDHRRAMAAKRRVLELLARRFFAEPSARRTEFEAFARDRTVRDYASFRANGERRGASWWVWPGRERDGSIPMEGGHREAFRYHAYVQWLMATQMEELGTRATRAGARLYFDLPLGVHADGYDVWRERASFVLEATAGSPPDPFFGKGQDWGFPPLHPERIREQGYRYVVACLRHVLQHAGVLRIDHVMSFHRLYWVPRGFDSLHGVYVRYRPDELYGILALESSRGDAVIVGEDLGTVPETVRHGMRRHGIYRSHVLQMEVRPDVRRALDPPPRRSLASLNSHDMAPFAAFWKGSDLAARIEREALDRAASRRERAERDRIRAALVRFLRSHGWLPTDRSGKDGPGTRDALRACLSYLAAGEARIVLVNLEDLWLEERPQNVPGTSQEYPNWRRPARHPFEKFRQMRRVTGTLKNIDELRKRWDPR